MTEIPEHLLKRAAAARDKAAETPAAGGAGRRRTAPRPRRRPIRASPNTCCSAARPPRPPKQAAATTPSRRRRRGRGRRQGRRRRQPHLPAAAGVPVGAGPGGHTQRLLTVVKSGSIQDVKAMPVDKVHTWPHLLAAEFVAALACTAFVFIFSVFVNAPLLQLANTNQTPNPSKAPWYFLGLQELLTMFHPMIAGVTLPGRRSDRVDPRPVPRPQPVDQARGSQVRHLADDRAHDVLGGARHHRIVLPRPRLQLRPALGRRPVLRALETAKGDPHMSTAAVIAIVIGVVVVLAAVSFFTLARRSDVRGAGALSGETVQRDKSARRAHAPPPVESAATTAAEVEAAGIGQPHDQHRRSPRSIATQEIVPWTPPDPEAIGETRRQFFNRATVTLMSVGLVTFAASAFVAFLWPTGTGGFGGQVNVGKLGDIKDGIKQGNGFFYAAEARSWITEYPAEALPAAELVYPETLLVTMRQGIVDPQPEVPAPRLSRAASARPASGSSASATARSTTASARRRPALRRAAWTGSPATIAANGDVTIDTGKRRHRPRHRHEHHRPGGRGSALHRWRGALMTAVILASTTTTIAVIGLIVITARVDRLRHLQRRRRAQGGRLGDRARRQPQAVLRRRDPGRSAPRARPADRRAPARGHRRRPSALLGVRAEPSGRGAGGLGQAVRQLGFASCSHRPRTVASTAPAATAAWVPSAARRRSR